MGWRMTGAAAGALLAAAPALAVDCAGLAQARLANAEVTGATLVKAGSEPLKPAADLCRVTATARPSPRSDVRLELWIPQGTAWNGKFMQAGNGGFAGSIPVRAMSAIAAAGYAAAGTDNGHQATDATDARWALGQPEKVIDFGWRGVKATTDAAKALLAAYAGKAPARSYFAGCSDGGREALMSAQRYPADFDGIIAGAPAHAWTALMASGGLLEQAMSKPGAELTAAKLPALQAAALQACGNAQGFVAAPNACAFDPGVLACTGAETDQCLTKAQLGTVRAVYAGLRNPATGKRLPGLVPGAEQAWEGWLVADRKPTGEQGFAPSYFANMVRGDPAFRIADLTTRDLRRSERELGPILNATSADLSAFRARGGKLIMYHGWNDPAIAPAHTLAYLDAVERRTGGTADFVRAYMVPGMLHCGGGAGPSRVDWRKLIDDWVERGVAPGNVSAAAADGRTQLLSPVPAPRSGGRAGSR